ncbi:hypothetical protein Q7O56_20175 [Pseudomonas protegens]|uniref:hypothetical protein n=1 Tax=Pseudomonas protegens TaxID=380021 RepID=UPI00276DA028|nr:hypothetical protein [Pseudomonas protegens]MDP9511358.1 hypothetical protein [Pseudomonas protegens]
MKLKAEVVGSVTTVVYLVGVAVLVYVKRETLPGLELNAIGDFLAGVFGPIAFLWLVLGYLQQGRELKLSSEALRMQADELRASVEQQAIMAEAATRQLQSQQEVFDLQVWKHEREISPDFEFKTFLNYMLPDGVVKSSMRIRNKGHSVRFVLFGFERVIDVERELFFGDLESGTWSDDVDFKFHTPEALTIGRCFVEYLRVDNQTLRDEFSISVTPRGDLTIEKTAPSACS